jgi:hypothetical protein
MQISLESKPTTLKISLHNTKFSLENISAHKRDGSELDLSGQELGDQDMQVVIQYALTNSNVSSQIGYFPITTIIKIFAPYRN